MIGIWAGLFVVAGVASGSGWWPVLATLPVVASLGLRGPVPRRQARALAVLGLLMLAGIGLIRAEVAAPLPSLAAIPGVDRVEGRVVSPVQTDLQYQHLNVALSRLRSGGTWSESEGIVRVVAPRSPPISYGDVVGLTGELTSLEDVEPGYRG